MVKLGDVCKQVRGVSYKPTDVCNSLSENAVTLLRANNIFENTLNYDDLVFVDKSKVSSCQYMKKGDILICASSGSKNLVGKAACLLEDKELTFGAFCKVIRATSISYEYLKHYFFSPIYRTTISHLSAGANINNIKSEDLENLQIPLPSLEMQKQIAAVLDKCTTIIAKRQQQLSALDNLIKARFVEMFGDESNPKGWELKAFEDITDLITDGEHATPRRTDNGIYLLSARNVLNHSLQLEDVDYIDEEEYERISKRIVPQAGDILLSCSGTVGRCCCVPEGLKFQMVRSAAILRFKKVLNPVFAEYMISSEYVQKQIDKAKTASSQANLFQGKIAKLKGFVPPIELQDEFLGFVKQVDKSKVAVQNALDKTQTLFHSLMQQYFG